MDELLSQVLALASASGLAHLGWQTPVMWTIGGLFIYLGIKKKIEPLLLVPIGFSVVMVKMPLGGLMDDGGSHGGLPGLFWLFNEYGLRTELRQ